MIRLLLICMLTIGCHAQIKSSVDYIWPNCAPPDPKLGPMRTSMGIAQYEQKEVSPKHWQWVLDEEDLKRSEEEEKKKYDLWVALQTRPLTNEEMTKVLAYGDALNTPLGTSYDPVQKSKILQNAYVNQFKMQLIKKEYDARRVSKK